eukprot:jgi/Undpi1/16/HiC_scaffold_1.g00016.m1
MRAGGITPPPEATAALIRALAKGGRGSTEALRLLGDMQASPRAGGRGPRRSPESGGGGGGGWEDRDAAARSAGFDGAIEACAVNGEWQKAVSLLDEMREARMSPDGRCYGNAMRACATGGNWQLALALLNTMKKEGVTRTAFNFNIAMQDDGDRSWVVYVVGVGSGGYGGGGSPACRKAGRNGKAISLLAEMEKDKVAPDIVTYNTCVTIAGQAGRLDEALELLRKASEDSGLELDVVSPDDGGGAGAGGGSGGGGVSYRAALGGLRREKRWEAAVKLLGDMQRRGLGHDEVSTAMAMNTCVAAQQPRRALDLFRDMRDVGRVFPRLPSVTALLEALADLGQWEEALRELRALSASGVKPDGRAIAYTMVACNSAKKWDQTLSLQHYADKMSIEIARKDWQGVVGVLAAAEKACSNAAEAAAAAAADSGGYGGDGGRGVGLRHPPADLYEVVARALARAGMWEEAAGAVRRLEKLPPRRAGQRAAAASLSTYELILGAAASAGQDNAVLSEADAARAALREADSSSDVRSLYSADQNRGKSSSASSTSRSANGGVSASGSGGGGGGRGGELNPGGLAYEVAAAGRLGMWDRVSPVMAKAMRSPSLRGVAGARLYAALIGAATACGKPERGLEVFREMSDDAAATASTASGGDGGVGEAGVGGGGGGGGLGLGAGRRLPPPDAATFMAALDACAAVGGEESVALAVGVTKEAAAAARMFQDAPGDEQEEESSSSSGSSGSSSSGIDHSSSGVNIGSSGSESTGNGGGASGSGATADGASRAKKMSIRNLAAVLARAGEVCEAAGKTSTAQALAAKASELIGLPPPPPPPTAVASAAAAGVATASAGSPLAPEATEGGAPGGGALLDGEGDGGEGGGEVEQSDDVAAAAARAL